VLFRSHDQTADALARDIERIPHANVTTVPFHLGKQRPGQPPSAQGATAEALDAGGDPFPYGSGGPLQGLAHSVDLVLRGFTEDLREEIGLGGEVPVHRADRDSRPLGNRGDLGREVATLGDQLACGGGDAPAGLRAARLCSRCAPVGDGKK